MHHHHHHRHRMRYILLVFAVIIFVLLFVYIFLWNRYNSASDSAEIAEIADQIQQERKEEEEYYKLTVLDNPVSVEDDALVSAYDVVNNGYDGEILLDPSAFSEEASIVSAWSGSDATASLKLSCVIFENEIAILQFKAYTEEGSAPLTVVYGETSSTVTVSRKPTVFYIPIAGECDIESIQFRMDAGEFVPTVIDEVYLINYGEQTDLSALRTGIYEEYGCGTSVVKAEDYLLKGEFIQCLVDGNYLYTLAGGTVSSYVLTSDGYELTDQVTGMGDGRDMVFIDDKNVVLVSGGINGMYLLDVSDPEKISVASHYATLERGTGIAVSGDYAFVCSRYFGIEIVDISDAYHPVYVGVVPGDSEYRDCFVSDGYLYAGTYSQKRIDVYDVSDLASPVLCSQIDLDGAGQGCYVEDGILYAATGLNSSNSPNSSVSDFSRGTGNGLEIYDVSDPYNPVHLSTSKTLGRMSYSNYDVWDVVVSEGFAYLSSMYNGIYVFDVTDPRDPVCVDIFQIEASADSEFYQELDMEKYAFPFDTSKKTMGCVYHVCLEDGCMYAVVRNMGIYQINADYIQGLQDASLYTYSVENTETEIPAVESCEVTLYENEQSVYAVAADGDYFYVAMGDGGIVVLDHDLNQQASYSTENAVLDLKIAGGYLFAAEGERGIGIWSLDGTSLKRVSSYCPTANRYYNTIAVTDDGNYIFAQTGRGERYIVIDASDKADPTEAMDPVSGVGTMLYRNLCAGVAGEDVKYFCAFGSSQQCWYSYDGRKLTYIDSIENGDYYSDSGGMTAVGEYAVYIGGGGYYYYDPSTDTLSSKITIDGVSLKGKCFSNGTLLTVVNGYNGDVVVVNVEEIDKPYLVTEFSVDGSPDIGIFEGDLMLIPCRNYGLLEIDLTDLIESSEEM